MCWKVTVEHPCTHQSAIDYTCELFRVTGTCPDPLKPYEYTDLACTFCRKTSIFWSKELGMVGFAYAKYGPLPSERPSQKPVPCLLLNRASDENAPSAGSVHGMTTRGKLGRFKRRRLGGARTRGGKSEKKVKSRVLKDEEIPFAGGLSDDDEPAGFGEKKEEEEAALKQGLIFDEEGNEFDYIKENEYRREHLELDPNDSRSFSSSSPTSSEDEDDDEEDDGDDDDDNSDRTTFKLRKNLPSTPSAFTAPISPLTLYTVAALLRRSGRPDWADDLESYPSRIAAGTMEANAGEACRQSFLALAMGRNKEQEWLSSLGLQKEEMMAMWCAMAVGLRRREEERWARNATKVVMGGGEEEDGDEYGEGMDGLEMPYFGDRGTGGGEELQDEGPEDDEVMEYTELAGQVGDEVLKDVDLDMDGR